MTSQQFGELYRQGLSEPEISRELKISQPTVHQYLERIIERLKAIALILYNRGANLPTTSLSSPYWGPRHKPTECLWWGERRQ